MQCAICQSRVVNLFLPPKAITNFRGGGLGGRRGTVTDSAETKGNNGIAASRKAGHERREATLVPDFRACPMCGADLIIAAEMRLYATNILRNISLSMSGELVYAHWGNSVPDWSTQQLQYFWCHSCDRMLPAEYQRVLKGIVRTAS